MKSLSSPKLLSRQRRNIGVSYAFQISTKRILGSQSSPFRIYVDSRGCDRFEFGQAGESLLKSCASHLFPLSRLDSRSALSDPVLAELPVTSLRQAHRNLSGHEGIF